MGRLHPGFDREVAVLPSSGFTIHVHIISLDYIVAGG